MTALRTKVSPGGVAELDAALGQHVAELERDVLLLDDLWDASAWKIWRRSARS